MGGDRKRFEELLEGGRGIPKDQISEELIRSHHEILLRATPILAYVKETRGLSDAAIVRHHIGFDADRIWVPLYKDGKPINVRRFAKPGERTRYKVLNIAGRGDATVFPDDVLKKEDAVVLCEGEWDAMLANDRGIPTVTFTGGAGTIPKQDELERFRGKDVAIAYDCDAAGKKGGLQAGSALYSIAASVKIIDLDLPKRGDDITDWFQREKRSSAELREIIERTDVFVPKAPRTKVVIQDGDAKDVHLADSGKSEFAYQRIKLPFHVAGKDIAPYMIPWKINWKCDMGSKLCSTCTLAHRGGNMEVEIDETAPDEIIEMVGSPRTSMEKSIRRISGVPVGCPKPSLEIEVWQNIEKLQAIPDLDFSYEGKSYTIRGVFRRGFGTEANHRYIAEGIALPDPENQTATILFYNFEDSKDSLDKFEITEEFLKSQDIFKVRKAVAR